MTIHKYFVYFLLTITLSGCLGKPTQPYVEYKPLKYSFYVSSDYHNTYNHIKEMAQKCIPNHGVSRTKVSGNITHFTKSAEITVSQQGITGMFTHINISLATEANKTHVKVSNSLKRWDPYAKAIQNWATGTNSCK